MQALLNTAVKAARRAAHLITRNIDQLHRIKIEAKGRADFVSAVDRDAEAEIVDVLMNAYPDHAIVGEEGSSKEGKDFEWIIDPLDGTNNYVQGIPHYCISIAARKKGVIHVGVIFDPIRNELFTAVRDTGSALNGRRIRVSKRARLDRAVVGTGLPFHALERVDPWLKCVREVTFKTAGIRRSASSALDMAYVAAGRLDAHFEPELKIWDIAAGVLLVREAGGLVCDFSGENGFFESGDVLATNMALHDAFREITSPLAREE